MSTTLIPKGADSARRRGRAPRALLLATAALLFGCGSGPQNPETVAVGFYSAVADRNGSAACEQLSDSTVSKLESDEQAPCAKAVLELNLSGTKAGSSKEYVTEAKVDLVRGDSVFLSRAPGGWRVDAAGCKPQPGEEQPYECEVES